MTDETKMSRRAMLASMMGVAVSASALNVLLPALAGAGGVPLTVTVYKDPSCGCCKKWVAHLQENGFTPTVHDRTDMNALKDSMGVPVALRSCHTAVVGKYVIEGHVPAADIKKLLGSTPKDVVGLAAPGMPAGSPGMEMSGKGDRYDVIAFGASGLSRAFASHG